MSHNKTTYRIRENWSDDHVAVVVRDCDGGKGTTEKEDNTQRMQGDGDWGQQRTVVDCSKNGVDTATTTAEQLMSRRFPKEIVNRISFLALSTLLHEKKGPIHRQLLEEDVFLTVVDLRNWDGNDCLHATRIPALMRVDYGRMR